MERTKKINNDFYETLQEKWYEGNDHPIALLRSENALRNPWMAGLISLEFTKAKILDIGCGGGLLTNFLAKEGHEVHGIDLSETSLNRAKKKDETGKVVYQMASAYSLPYPDESFDVVSAMDLLEHVESPEAVIKEASRVLKKGGYFFFHTFNRNFLSYLIVIKGVDLCVRNAPKDMHVYSLFIKPKELKSLANRYGLKVESFKGLVPVLWQWPFWKMLITGIVDSRFKFRFTSSLRTGYSGFARKL